jgi:hypothetical protein
MLKNHGRQCGFDLSNCPDKEAHKAYTDFKPVEPTSPHYPKRQGDVIIKRHETMLIQGDKNVKGFKYSAELTDGYHDTIVRGPTSLTEGEALRQLGVEVEIKAEILLKKGQALRAITTP